KGSTENASLLKAGDIDIGLVSGEVTHEAFASQIPGAAGLGVMAVMNSTPAMLAVRADSRFHRIIELKGRPVAWGGKGQGITIQARYIMDGVGLDMNRDFEAVYLEKSSEGPAMVMSGRTAALFGSGYRWPGFVTLSTNPIGMRFVVPDQREIQRVCTKYSFMSRFTVPAGQYSGQYDPIETVGSWNYILGRPELDEAMGYRFAASLHKAEKLGLLLKHLAQSTAKNTLAAISGPNQLSAGVLQYYRKSGLLQS
ncbi:MAG: TAXI family TRAP transporter solute-binding subunit, partial [Alphaproteobacteria bacterium]|nr:TAXI family TRAP transporter solute-binding subunit [Alphaproteobacteria bacterium]